jgi:hypothetical protein
VRSRHKESPTGHIVFEFDAMIAGGSADSEMSRPPPFTDFGDFETPIVELRNPFIITTLEY